jgi:hypothetical protein
MISFIAFDDTVYAKSPSSVLNKLGASVNNSQLDQRLLTIQGYRTVVIYSMTTFAPTFIIPFQTWVRKLNSDTTPRLALLCPTYACGFVCARCHRQHGHLADSCTASRRNARSGGHKYRVNLKPGPQTSRRKQGRWRLVMTGSVW